MQLIAFQTEAALRIGETVITRPGTEARIACFLASLETRKEGEEGFVEAAQSILRDLAVNACHLVVNLADLRQFGALLGVGNRFMCDAVGVASVLQAGVVQIAAHAEGSLKSPG